MLFPDENFQYIYMEAGDETPVLQLPNFDTFKNAKPQYFDFPDTIIHYLLSEGTLKIYEKLIKSCKYFYYKKKALIFENVLLLTARTPDLENTITFHIGRLSKIGITYEFFIRDDVSSHNLVSKLCPKIYKCEAIDVFIGNQDITEEEFNILVQPKFVLVLNLYKTNIINKSKNSILPIENVIKRVPKAQWVSIPGIPCTPNTFSNLANLKSGKTLKRLICQCGFPSHEYFELNAFLKFVSEQAPPKARYKVDLVNLDVERFIEYENKLNEFVDAWNPKEEKPELMLTGNGEYYGRRIFNEELKLEN